MVEAVASYEATGPSRIAEAALGGFEPRPQSIANITADTASTFGGVAVQNGQRLPAVMYGERLVTVYQGQAYYRSLGESASQLEGMAQPFYKQRGTFYEMLGVQEQTWVREGAENINRGWVIKGYDEQTMQFLGENIRSRPALRNVSFDIQGTFNTPEPINQWLGNNGFAPWIDIRHFFQGEGNPLELLE
jgi:hypothetical protein